MAAVEDGPRSTPALGRAGGFSDWLPGAAGRRRDLTDAFVRVFESWGYGLLGTPLVEPLDTVAAGIGAAFVGEETSMSSLRLYCFRSTGVGKIIRGSADRPAR